MPKAYAVDLVVKVAEQRHLPNILNGIKHLAFQVDPHAGVSHKRPLTVVASLVVEPGSINRITDLVHRYEAFLDDVELHVMADNGSEMIQLIENKHRSLSELGLRDKTIKLLHKAGIDSVQDLTTTTRRHLRVFCKGIGPVKIREIEDALAIEGLSLADE